MDSPDTNQDSPSGIGRRRVLGVGLAAGTVAWVAPAILSVDAASAATTQPPGGNGSIAGVISYCQRPVDPSEVFDVLATQNPGGATGNATSDKTGAFTISGLPAGTYDIVLHPTDGIAGRPDQSYPGAAIVVNGATATFNPFYDAGGC